MAIDSTKLLVAVKAYSRGNALPLDASSVHETLAAAQTYADSAIAYGGQVITALVDGKYKAYMLQPKAEGTGFNLSPIGIDGEIDPTKVKEYVKVVEALPEADQEQGVIYINITDNKGYIYTGSGFKVIFEQVENLKATIEAIQVKLDSLAGEGEGSVKKALADAKAYTDTTVAGKADKATTLAGYGIADAYTKDEANTAIAAAVANAHHLKREIVSVLPEVSEANEDTIYMVPDAGSTDAAGSNKSVYTEYMLVNGAFERIGTSDVDLSNYFTKDQVTDAITTAKGEAATDAQTKADAAKDAAIAAAATDATTKADAAQAAAITEAGKKADKALEDAKAYSDGLAKNYATAAQGAKADSALQAADVVEGTVNGAISVKGTPVKVHGLGTAAYAATDDFATAAQGAKADSAVQAADVVSGTANGTISVKGSNVAVKGLGSAAYQNSGAFDVSGAAAGALTEAKAYADTKKTEAVDAAAKDATTKADNALTAAKKYADGLLSGVRSNLN